MREVGVSLTGLLDPSIMELNPELKVMTDSDDLSPSGDSDVRGDGRRWCCIAERSGRRSRLEVSTTQLCEESPKFESLPEPENDETETEPPLSERTSGSGNSSMLDARLDSEGAGGECTSGGDFGARDFV
jgi:hypothetical protein